MELSPIVAIIQYLDDEERFPHLYVQVEGDKFEAVVEAVESFEITRVLGRYDRRDDAIRALWHYRDQWWQLVQWNVRGQRPH